MTPTQADRDLFKVFLGEHLPDGVQATIDAGGFDSRAEMQAVVAHRLAAEAAAFEKAAGVPLQISGLIGASTGSSIDSALCQASEAIRNLAGEKHD